MLKEWLARGMIVLGLALVASTPLVSRWQNSQGIVIHARMAENGGWTPENLTATVGEPLHLRLTSDDVTHGFAVGGIDHAPVDILPGEMTDITLVFTRPGKYTYYCTRWCSVNHWRMRGTIEVTGPGLTPGPAISPLYVTLGLNIDTPHKASLVPAQTPSAGNGASFSKEIPQGYATREYYLSHTPLDLYTSLRAVPTFTNLTDQQVWDVVAWVWQLNTTPQEVQQGQELFSANCAACHGEAGAGNGVFANQVAAQSGSGMADSGMAGQSTRPVNFTDPQNLLSASPAHLQGKILRGGMGTGMPSWGAIFTDDQTWALVAYLYTFQYQMEVSK